MTPNPAPASRSWCWNSARGLGIDLMPMLRATAVLPVKRFDAAKRRLGVGLEDEQRRAIVAAMLEDVLEAIGAARMVEGVLVVTGEPAAAKAARSAGADVLADPDDEGQ